jgi:hypothetical protein
LACPRYDRRYIKFEQPEAQRRQPRASYCIVRSDRQRRGGQQWPEKQELGKGLSEYGQRRLQELEQSAPSLQPLAPLTTCVIKGNISSHGHIYHMPGQNYYAQTIIDESKGERWFCTEDEALAAGWRKAKT